MDDGDTSEQQLLLDLHRLQGVVGTRKPVALEKENVRDGNIVKRSPVESQETWTSEVGSRDAVIEANVIVGMEVLALHVSQVSKGGIKSDSVLLGRGDSPLQLLEQADLLLVGAAT
jgi:hypothetical protein